MKSYDHKNIEKKWQENWSKAKLYETKDSVSGKDNFYLLVEFPYPSGNLHVGHWYSFAVPDILARKMRMEGKNVLYPIGFDAFGLPAENAAIKNKVNPREWTESNIDYMRNQIRSMGASFDWTREVVTCDPDYYKWTQWLFLQLYKSNLVYRKETMVNWCPNDKTVLANEQVVDGKCERCGHEVIQKEMLQWNIKITEYADRLVDDLNKLDWPEPIKESQKNWIGRSEGAEIDFGLDLGKDDSRFVLLHGRQGSPGENFFPWLKEELEKRGYQVEVPELPGTAEPDDEEQTDYVEKNCTLDERTVVVGHSFGGIVALRLLERGHKVRRVVLAASVVSGRFNDGKVRASVTRACEKGFDFKTIKNNSKTFMVLPDVTDPIVPIGDAETLAKELSAMYMPGKGSDIHFTGLKEPDILMACIPTIRVFTTRPDTLFGAAYLVLAPEHPWVTLGLQHTSDADVGHRMSHIIKNFKEVMAYVDQAKKKTELERQTDQKEKTGVKLEGVEAINPATNEKIPLFVADYVLAGYGTGAIMAVPAHDERDHEFAQKFGLPIKQVVAQVLRATSGGEAVRPDVDWKERDAVMGIVKHWENDEYLCIEWKDHDMRTFPSGGIEKDENPADAAAREVAEETGYGNISIEKQLGGFRYLEFYHRIKKTNVRARFRYFAGVLRDGEHTEISAEESGMHRVVWKRRDELPPFLLIKEKDRVLDLLDGKDEPPFTGQGMLVNSGKFDGMDSAEAKQKMTEEFGRRKTTYKLRDWIVSRQRYWGVPIPVIHCPKCGIVPVPDDQLPVLLPETEDYLPDGKGKSPLAKVSSFVNVKCPQCKGDAERETDTLDTFVDSSWYFLRYTDPKNKKEFALKDKQKDWMPIDLYSGGAEHTTMHLLYSRFWHKALFDRGLVNEDEPYTHRENHGLVLGTDGQKMSKSKGNVMDPDAIVEQVGADTVRMYLAFMGPYTGGASYPWNPGGVVGLRRFLERVWKLQDKLIPNNKGITTFLNNSMQLAIKKVDEDVSLLKFNTAISQLMILLNFFEKQDVTVEVYEDFLRLLAPFAPHITEEIWRELLKNKTSIHLEPWPAYNPELIDTQAVTYVLQVNGKKRAELVIPHGTDDKESVEKAARTILKERLEREKVIRVVIVPGRLVNFVTS